MSVDPKEAAAFANILGKLDGVEKGKQVVEAFFKFQKVVANHNKYSHIFKTTAKKVLTERGIAWFTKAMKVHKKMNTNSLLNHKDKS